MKTRCGFVSNSSSSSFIVVFPHKPMSIDDLMQIMFCGQEGIIQPYDDSLTHTQVVTRVFKDIKNIKSISESEVREQLSGHYTYYPNRFNSVFSFEDSDRGAWKEGNKYFAIDRETWEEFKKAINEAEEERYRLQNELNEILDTYIKKVSFAYKDKDGKYTKKQIDAFEKYQKKADKFIKNNSEYIKVVEKRDNFYNESRRQENLLRKKMAEVDARAFFNDNKDSFIIGLEYGDENNKEGSVLEHGNIFRNVKHLKINNH